MCRPRRPTEARSCPTPAGPAFQRLLTTLAASHLADGCGSFLRAWKAMESWKPGDLEDWAFLKTFWNPPGRSQGASWVLSGNPLEALWEPSGGTLWEQSGRFLGAFWGPSGSLLVIGACLGACLGPCLGPVLGACLPAPRGGRHLPGAGHPLGANHLAGACVGPGAGPGARGIANPRGGAGSVGKNPWV